MESESLDRTGSPRPPRPPPTVWWPSSDDEEEGEAAGTRGAERVGGTDAESQTGDIESAYEFTKQVLGKGSVATVRSAVNLKTKEAVAIKIVPKKKCEHDGEKSIRQEIAVLQRLRHPNCIEFREVYETDAFIFIVMEQVNGGEMLDRIMEKSVYSETEAATAFVQMISALEYIHSIGIAHRDMKPDNILYKSMDPDSPIKLADFGHASLKAASIVPNDSPQSNPMQTFVGTPIYVAPEVLQRNGYGKECDVWSSGIILYILLCGFPPFDQEAHQSVLFDRIKRGKYDFPDPFWTNISAEAKNLVSAMMCVDIDKRITPTQCLSHPWLKKYEEGSISESQMPHMQEELRKWNSARKFKGAISTLSALQRMVSGKELHVPTPEQAAEVLRRVKADPERLQELEESFNLLDRDKSGKISTVNLNDAIGSLGHKRTEDEIRNMIQRFDVHKTGDITFDEFCIVMGPRIRDRSVSVATEREMKATFQAFDFLGTGAITHMELKEVLRRLGSDASDTEVAHMIEIADVNSDGVIDFNEFKALIAKTFTSS
uniref:Calmodulin n=1 Tax=Hemiselmis tepida TaxID=464990 RepID=A0A7S0VIV0_9CRYP|mmetsp:Transcript_19213/g.48583  ORF Transcript_19213/g.48583 Transcript_19213/m.48583 type:complete len:545 (+) Transcript_19213:60-1694(+)